MEFEREETIPLLATPKVCQYPQVQSSRRILMPIIQFQIIINSFPMTIKLAISSILLQVKISILTTNLFLKIMKSMIKAFKSMY